MDETTDKEPINPKFTYATVGILIYRPSEKWKNAGVLPGDFLGSTSHTGDVNSPEKIRAALAAPDGAVLLITRDNKRMEITL